GEGITAGQEVGGAIELMDQAWWMPAVKFADGTTFSLLAERQYPGQFIVNRAGRRFINESSPYTPFGNAQSEGQRPGIRHVPAWMIFDDRAWKRNFIAGHVPGSPMPKHWLGSGLVHTAPSLEALAPLIDVPADALRETAERFNGFAVQGTD